MSKDKIELSPDEYRTLVNAIDDKIYNLTTVIDRVSKKNNDVWVEQVDILLKIKDRLEKLNQNNYDIKTT
jgi:hypothetical protein|tara:strand:- start:173 stop:382 length:210 start_codon:yes stop_codon:yes gene_type:complete